MEKTKVIVDTCFLHKISSEGKNIENIKRILDELGYIPVTHPYVAQQELSLHSGYDVLLKEGYIKIIDYSEFIHDVFEKQLYESYFVALYEDLRLYLEAKGGLKQMDRLVLERGQTIYDIHKQGSSVADVHLILMASFLRLPLLLTEDSDIELLRTMSKKRISLGDYALQIYNAMDLMKQLARKPDSSIGKKELEKILDQMQERKSRSEIRTIWAECHT